MGLEAAGALAEWVAVGGWVDTRVLVLAFKVGTQPLEEPCLDCGEKP